MRESSLSKRSAKRTLLLLMLLTGVTIAGAAKEFTTTLQKGVQVTYLVNTTDKIARVKKVEDTGMSTPAKITIPEKVVYKEGTKSYTLKVVGIADEALRMTWYTTVVLPPSIKTIGKEAFCLSSITSIDLPSKLETIGEKAFESASLTGPVTIPASCRSIGAHAFSGTHITAVNFKGTNTTPLTLGEGAFSGTDIVTVSLTRVESMGEFVFGACEKLQTVSLSGNMTTLPAMTFSGCRSLTRVGIPVVSRIGEWTFHNCKSLREFDFLPGLKSIGHSAFQESGIVAVRLKEGFETMEEEVFFQCPDLTIVEFPSTMRSIGESAFQQSPNITYVSCNAVTPPMMLDATFQKYEGVTVWVPTNSIDAYERAMGWRCFDYDHLRPTGINSVERDGETAIYYDMQGRVIPSGSDYHGPAVKICGNETSKVIR